MLTRWILAAMVAGAAFGYLAPEPAKSLTIITSVFLRLIRSIIAPVLFGVLIRALAGAGTPKDLGRVGWKSVLYFEIVSSLALITGWVTCLVFQPGAGATLATTQKAAQAPPDAASLITNMFPSSIIDAMARGDILQITIFCLLFGLACAALGPLAEPMVRFAGAVAEVAFGYTRYVMYLAPAAVFTAMAVTIAENGSATLTGLATFVLAAWIAQTAFCLVVQGGSVWISGLPIRRFINAVREPFLVAFATTSSAAALPQTLDALRRLGIPERIVGIVAPLSLSFNMGGSCIHLAMCAFFVAQAAGIHLPLSQQLLILATLKLTSKGVAGIPRANFVVLTGLFTTFQLPAEGLTVLLGIDALIDPVRTSVNVLGHCAAPPVIARWEGMDLSCDTDAATETRTAEPEPAESA